VIVRNSLENLKDLIIIPPYEEIANDKERFNEAFRKTYEEQDPYRAGR